jgi:hypothetical protein
MSMGAKARLLSRVVAGEGGCWIFTGGGQFEGREPHRVSWELHHNLKLEELQCGHRCGNPACVRPDHLIIRTALDLLAAEIRKVRTPQPTGKMRRL